MPSPQPSATSPEPSPETGARALPHGVVATGIGSWPGRDVREALRVVRGELVDGAVPEGVAALPYLPELPARGAGADMVGRAAHLFVDLPVDLQPQGWRLVDRPGRDAERAASWWRQDLDELAEAFEGYTGLLKLQVTGPWTLAASVWLPLGDRVLSDPGATRDLAESLAEGVALHLARVRALVPGARLVLQVDEPSLPAVLAGRIRSDSGYRTLRAPERGAVVAAVARVVDRARSAGAVLSGVHCCAGDPPVDVLHEAGAGFLALDLAELPPARWEQVAVAVEAGARLWAGLDVTGAVGEDVLHPLLRPWHELGLPVARVAEVGIAPPCGLAGSTPEEARATTAATVVAAARLAEVAQG